MQPNQNRPRGPIIQLVQREQNGNESVQNIDMLTFMEQMNLGRQDRQAFQLLAPLIMMLNRGENFDYSNNGGLNKEEQDNFGNTQYHKKQGQKDEEGRCTICMCDFEEGEDIKFLACTHKFHSPCITPWLDKNSCCPVCKKDMKEFI